MKQLLFLAAALSLVACGAEQQRRTLPIEVTAARSSEPNHHGWTVTLDRAKASLGPVRFFSGKAAIASRFHPLSLLVGTAWAHPGHDDVGDTMGELLQTRTVDLLSATPVELGVADAVTGEYGSAELELPAGSDLEGASVRLAGTATAEDGTMVRFRASLVVPGAISGVAFERSVGTEPGRVRITVDLGRWLSRIDFARAGTADAGGVVTFAADSQAMNALTRGVEDVSAYRFTWEQ